MKERKGIFKGYSIEKFWPMFIGHTIDTMVYAKLMSGDKPETRQKIMNLSFELLYTVYKTTFKEKQKFFDYGNEVVLAILDTKYPINDDGTINIKGILQTLKSNWTKNYNYIYDITR